MEDYLKAYDLLHQAGKKLQNAAAKLCTDHHIDATLRTARLLDMLASDQKTFIFDKESDIDILMDCLIYEQKIGQGNGMAAFLASYACVDETERLLAYALPKAKLGLYRVHDTQPERGELTLKALVADAKDTTLINRYFAYTAKTGLILATHIVQLPDFSVSTGALFLFPPKQEKRVVGEWWKKQGIDRYAHVFKLSRKIGIRVEYGPTDE